MNDHRLALPDFGGCVRPEHWHAPGDSTLASASFLLFAGNIVG